MQTRQQVFCEIKDHIMLIRVDNPETKNGLDWDGIEQLARSYEELQNNPDVRVGIITGNEQYFYTGGRVDPNAPGEKDKYTDALTHFLKASGAVTKPMIAAVNGDCMKAGMGVLALCDFAVARKGVVFTGCDLRVVPYQMNRGILNIPVQTVLAEACENIHADGQAVAAEYAGKAILERYNGAVEHAVGTGVAVTTDDGVCIIAPERGAGVCRRFLPRNIGQCAADDFSHT